MTGRLAVLGPEDEPLRYARTTLYLDDERRLELDDARRWASVRLVADVEELVAGLGPDALDAGFFADVFVERVTGRRAPIKSVLLDQKVLAGVGNIYADEALLRAGISPARRVHRISEARLRALHAAIITVLKRALDFIARHPDDRGRPYVVDAHDERMSIPRRKGAPCPVCGRALKSRVLGARTAYYCGSCQR